MAYTKISCFLPWVAEQFGLSYPAVEDEACTQGVGEKPPFNSTHEYNSTCRATPGSGGLPSSFTPDGDGEGEYPCTWVQ